jgi:hypothetical protein
LEHLLKNDRFYAKYKVMENMSFYSKFNALPDNLKRQAQVKDYIEFLSENGKTLQQGNRSFVSRYETGTPGPAAKTPGTAAKTSRFTGEILCFRLKFQAPRLKLQAPRLKLRGLRVKFYAFG